MRVDSPLLPATALFWQPRGRPFELVVLVKASFELAPGRARLASQQDPVVERDHHWNDDPGRFLVMASDWVPAKRGVDVVYVGRLLGPGPGRLRVGTIDKTVEARPDRWASLGPLALETRGAPEAVAWARAWTTLPMPEGVSTEIFNVAPPDQRLVELAEGLELWLENLEPGTSLRSTLPPLRPIAEADLGAGSVRVPLRADTLAIDGERGIASVVWRGTLPVASPAAVRAVSVAIEGASPAASATGGAAAPAVAAAAPTSPARAATVRTALPSVDPLASAPLPFGPSDALSRLAVRSPNRGAPPGTPWAAAAEPPPWGGVAPTVDRAPPVPSQPQPPPAVEPPAVHGGPWPRSAEPAAQPPRPAPQPPAREPIPRHASSAALGGIAMASNAALRTPEATSRAVSPSTTPRGAVGGMERRGARLLWHDEESVVSIRTHPRHKLALQRRERTVAERRHVLESADAEDAAEVLVVLQEVAPIREAELGAALERGFDDEGRFVPDLVRVDGALAVALDETELLAALVSTMAPFSKQDERVGGAVEAASAYLEAARRVGVPEIAARLSDSLRTAWSDWNGRPIAAVEVDELASRAALERRAYRKKHVFGGLHLRATLSLGESATVHTAYLPEACAPSLPLFLGFGVRTLCQVHPKEDASERSAWALRVVALARTIDEPEAT